MYLAALLLSSSLVSLTCTDGICVGKAQQCLSFFEWLKCQANHPGTLADITGAGCGVLKKLSSVQVCDATAA